MSRHTRSLHDVVGLAVRWVEALEPVAGPPATAEDLAELAGRLALDAGSGLSDPCQATQIGEKLGRQLADANLTSPDALRRAVTALGDHWLAAPRPTGPAPEPRQAPGQVPDREQVPGRGLAHDQEPAHGPLPGSESGDSPEQRGSADPRIDPACVTAMQGGLAAGHASAVQQLLLAQQEAIHRATVDARNLAQERLRHEAAHDRLTGLTNRACFLRRLDAVLTEPESPTPAPAESPAQAPAGSLAESRTGPQDDSPARCGTDSPTGSRDGVGSADRIVLGLLELEGFGAVNLAHGHHNGDLVLQQVAHRLVSAVEDLPVLLARFDGTEFAALLPDARPGDGDELAARLLAAFDTPIPVSDEGRAAQLAAHAGVVELITGQTRLDDALLASRLALRSARERNSHTCMPPTAEPSPTAGPPPARAQ